MTSPTAIGTVFGLALGLAAAIGGLSALLLVLVLGTAGLVVGRVVEGELDLTPYLGGRDRSRR